MSVRHLVAVSGLVLLAGCSSGLLTETPELTPAPTGYTGYPSGSIFFLPPGQTRPATAVAAAKERAAGMAAGRYNESMAPPDVFGVTSDCGAMSGRASDGGTGTTTALDCVPPSQARAALASRPTDATRP